MEKRAIIQEGLTPDETGKQSVEKTAAAGLGYDQELIKLDEAHLTRRAIDEMSKNLKGKK